MTENRSEKLLYRHEIETMKKRERIAAALREGWTYERIKQELGVGTSTISSVKKLIEERGIEGDATRKGER